MSDYSLVQRAVIQATSADGVGPKDATLTTAIKTGSAFVVSTIKSTRCRKRVQRGVENFTNATVFPVTVNLASAVDENCAHVIVNHVEEQAAPNRGVLVELINSGADLRFTSPALAAGETLDVAWQVIEEKEPLGANVRIVDTTTVRLEWDGTLAAGETIDAAFEVFDIENLGDDVKEILFRGQRVLAYLGENQIQDNLSKDDAGNIIAYRLRVFTDKASADAATIDTPGGLEAGELARVDMTQTVPVDNNDRTNLKRVLTDVLTPTPGVN